MKIALAMCMQEAFIDFEAFWGYDGLKLFTWYQVISNDIASWWSQIP